MQTLLKASVSPRNTFPGYITEEGLADVKIVVSDLGANHYPSHLIASFAPNNPMHMLLYPVHACILEMFCPSIRSSFGSSPMEDINFEPTLIPREVSIPVKQILLTFPETLGILLTYFYTRSLHLIVRQCLPMYTAKPDEEPVNDLLEEDNQDYVKSLGYVISQSVTYHTLIEYIMKTTMLAETALEMITIDIELWPLLDACYQVMLNALAFATAGCSLNVLSPMNED